MRDLFAVDLRTLALVRAGLGVTILLDLALRAADLTAHYTDAGVMPRADVLARHGLASYGSLHWWLSGSTAAVAAVFAAQALCAVALLAGFRTRIATVLCWYLAVSLSHRMPALLSAGDRTLQLVLFWSMFLPMGARWSVDSAMDTRPRGPNRFASVASAGLLLQVCSIYWLTAIEKLQTGMWPDGSAVEFALNLDRYVTAWGVWLRGAGPEVLALLTWGTLVFELLGPFLAFLPRWNAAGRIIAVILFSGLHIGFGLCLRLGIFPIESIVAWLAFMPGGFWDGLHRWLATPRRRGLAIWYDGGCSFCRRTVLTIRTFLLLPETPIRPAQEDAEIQAEMEARNSWVVVDYQGRRRHRFDALAYVLRCSPLAWPAGAVLGWAPLRAIGNAIYDVVARNRGAAARFIWFLRPRPVNIEPGRANQLLAAIAIGVMVILEIDSVWPPLHAAIPKEVRNALAALGLSQSWAMFTYEDSGDGWFNVVGRTEAGTEIDLLAGDEGPVRWQARPVPASHYPSARWEQFLYARGRPESRDWGPYARWLCRTWNEGHQPGERLEGVRVVFMQKGIDGLGLPVYRRVALHESRCDG